jgi:alpha-L-fucosidase
MAFLEGQLRELLTGYGTIDLLWFDGGWERPLDWWRPQHLESVIRELQPGIVLNDRLFGVGDYRTPEQFVPAQPPGGPWETCMTMNESWGWNPHDTELKSGRQIVHTLCEVVGRGGNLLLNVSPRGDGSLPPEQVERMAHLARWTSAHGEAVFATEPGLEPWQFYGPSTRRGDTVYLHLLSRPYDTVTVRGVPVKRVEGVRDVASGQELAFRTRTGILEAMHPDPDGEVTITVPADLVDDDATVLAVDFRPSS